MKTGKGPQPSAKRTLADDRVFETDWAVEHAGASAEERTETWGSMVKKRYTPPVRDRASTMVNNRRNLIFEGAPHVSVQQHALAGGV